MADFSNIIQEINEDITTNGVGDITGAKLNEVLRDMIAAVNAEKQDLLTIDATPTEDSTNPVQSGGVFTALANLIADGGLFGGFVNPSSIPNTKYYYLTDVAGIYPYFDNANVNDNSLTLFYYQNNSWQNAIIAPSYQFAGELYDDLAGKQDTISDLATIRSGAAAGATAYQKPSGGIPKTDLASGVQTSLGKADTAFQKPSGGIPASDLSTAVQTSLGKADTAVQQVTVGTTTTGNAGTNASVTNSGTATNPVLNFTIPRGDKGDNGQGITYKNADDVSDLPTPSSSQSAYIYLIPSTSEQGVVDQYACIEDAVVEGQVISGWSWVLIGTTAPVVSVQRVDTYQPLLQVKTVGSYVVKAAGGFTSSTTLETVIYDISDANKLVCDFTVIGAGNLVLSFFDDGLDINDLSTASSHYLGWRIDKNTPPYVVTQNTRFENQVINVDSDATLGSGDITGARYVGLTRLVSNHFGAVSVLTPVPQSLVKKQPIALNEILIFNTLIQLPQIWNSDTADSAEITTQQTLSTWGVVFPTSYTNIGNPTPIIAMLHGSNGYVGEGCLGYTSGGWITARDQYLAAGFAVMDINGYGVSTQADDKSKHWGCPAAIETLDKAFEFLKANYNVCDKLLIHGTSMGGILAQTYAKQFPGKVAAVACFAPNPFAYSVRYVDDPTKYVAWGYADKAAAISDNYSHLTGYVPINECQLIDDTSKVVTQFDWNDYPYEDRAQIMTKELIDSFPVPMRIWQGTSDTSVPYTNSQLITRALRNGNSNVSLRLCNGGSHDLAQLAYVRNEAVSWFKRFANL